MPFSWNIHTSTGLTAKARVAYHRRREYARDYHGEDLGAPCRAAVARGGVRLLTGRGVDLERLVVAHRRSSASLAPHELDHGLNRDAIPKYLRAVVERLALIVRGHRTSPLSMQYTLEQKVLP